MQKYFNEKYLNSLPVSKKTVKDRNSYLAEAHISKEQKETFDVFLSHSSKDKNLVGKVRDVIEKEYHFSAYVDWDENSGMLRTEVADTIKEVMTRCKTLLIVKTQNSDESSWVSWETGYFEALKFKNITDRFDQIGVLVIDNENFNQAVLENPFNCYHQEYLLRYTFVDENNLRTFIQQGAKKAREYNQCAKIF
ncbi:MAG: toll/interleukin-1 receptor domain-containing protein [Alphaproteobacteria bacterium]|nr:toll/interleukin-1 receptor domain-containing protein [Alphaproteobacteria bacterium]